MGRGGAGVRGRWAPAEPAPGRPGAAGPHLGLGLRGGLALRGFAGLSRAACSPGRRARGARLRRGGLGQRGTAQGVTLEALAVVRAAHRHPLCRPGAIAWDRGEHFRTSGAAALGKVSRGMIQAQ